MTAPLAAVGVDNGGTWIRLKGLSARGRCVWSLKKPSPTVENLPGFLLKHLGRLKGRLDVLAIGSRGLWKTSRRRAVKRALRGLAKKIVVMSDVEAAWISAFAGGGQGIVVICGTGSIAYGKKADGTFARAGGLGPDKGDEGSGYWIGKEWLKKRQSGTRTSVRQIASLAPAIIRKAQKGNPLAGEITSAAQIHLVTLVAALVRNLSWNGTIPISVSGSILENTWFQRGFFRALRKNKISFQLIQKKRDQTIAPLSLFCAPS